MRNTNIIYNLDLIQERLDELYKIEEDRIYCRHDLYHFLTVARICYILVLENDLDISKDLIYTTALLHDIGKKEQYEEGIPHDQSSATIAEEVLEYTDFSEDEKSMIIEAIKNHRGDKYSEKLDFNNLFKLADNLSRACFNCKPEESCKWSKERKNLEIIY